MIDINNIDLIAEELRKRYYMLAVPEGHLKEFKFLNKMEQAPWVRQAEFIQMVFKQYDRSPVE